MTEVRVTMFFTWGDGNGSDFHCGTVSGAKKFVQDKIAEGDVEAYSIQAIDWLPVFDSDPEGQLYGSVWYNEYKKV